MSRNYLLEVPPPWCAYISSLPPPLIQQKKDDTVDGNDDDDDDDVILLLAKSKCDPNSSMLLRTVVELVVNDSLTLNSGIMTTMNETKMIQLHPLLATGFLQNHSFPSNNQPVTKSSGDENNDGFHSFLLQKCPSLHYEAVTLSENYPQCVPIYGQKIVKMNIHRNNIESISLSVTIIFTTLWSKGFTNIKDLSEEKIKLALEGRIILQNSVVLLSIVNDAHPSSDSDFVLIYIHNVELKIKGQQKKQSDDLQYLVLGPDLPYTVGINPTSFQQLHLLQQPEQQSIVNETICPGYETLMNEITALAYLHQKSEEASPTAVLITGCAGVGKTQLVRTFFNFVIA